MSSKPLKNVCDEVHFQSSCALKASKFIKTELFHGDSDHRFTWQLYGYFKKLLKMATGISKNTFFSRTRSMDSSVNP